MCGILGKIKFHESINPQEEKEFKKTLKLLKHRGPDAEGILKENKYILGHRRLSIIDTDKRSNQPLKYKHLAITFNGEIYNFKEIKKELEVKGHKFKTTSDTEVILHSYEEWGEKCVKKFDGMWAFCISNNKTNEHFLSRDRIGEKPLVYYQNVKEFIFSSEIPSLLKLINKKEIKPNWKALANFNTYNFRHIPAPNTAYKEIYKLEPGFNLSIKYNKITTKKYFKIKQIKIENNKIKQGTKIIDQSIKQTSTSDVPIGLFLSGGVDSSLIVATLKNENITTYSLGFDKKDPELKRATKIAKKLGLKNKQIEFKNNKTYSNLIEQIKENIKFYGEPIHLYQIIYSNLILKEMKKDGIKVAIGGNGADELFYGYDGANNQKILSKIREIYRFFYLHKINPINKSYFKYLNMPLNKLKIEIYKEEIAKKKHIKKEYRDFVYSKEFKEISKELKSKKLINNFNWLGMRIENEHSITNVADISGSMNSMEIRTPFLNKLTLDYSTSLPLKYKVKSIFSKKHNKWILKQILAKKIGKNLTYYKKMGFGYGVKYEDIVLKYKKDFNYYINKIVPKIELFNRTEVQKLYKEHLEHKKNNQEKLLEIIIICIWWEEYNK